MSKPYLHGHHASVLKSHTWRTVENSCPHLIPYLSSPSLQILDVGCGPGTITVDLASRVPQGLVYGIDPSADVIAKARKHAEEKGVTNVRFEVGDVFDWERLDGVEQGSFDVVHAHQVLQHLQDPRGALVEMKKLAKAEGGIVAVRDADYAAMTWYPGDIPGLQTWQRLYIAVARSIKCDPNIGRRLHAVALEAGFPRSDIDASCGVWTFSTPDELAWWCGLWAERVVQSNFKKSAIESGLATEEDLQAVAQSWRELEKREDGWFAVPNGQVICHVRS
ncbi:S-adenosyl-L-methionine-dependent methyltransferase [Aaosphaeria arxii CBS 175.79]|uniref:S-adenosyl-L-methionine-dependent methyltransferase n=1 Tax=Aaosphaeria arxii CBS 175.79 TaxID=1450172 RepID=A0A6A5Y9F5_9PLEO|nr:S-adenosyl-L-methionine-dependent methyltransferase [Aaosphaeria arxii CBS 175.79]KAF2022048.1 S-adenosyl-L-methionine-dependent methyltransferase [Aaosphaeria arxii CBS 175.79]